VAYLNGPQLASASPDWFTAALAYACEPVKGAISPLTATAQVVGQVDGYLLADYLDQQGRAFRRSEPVPDSVWASLTTHTNMAADLNRLGSSAADRGRFRHACHLWAAAFDAGDMSMARSLRNQLNRAGHHAEADEVLARIAAAGDPEGLTLLTMLLRRDQRPDEIEQLLRHAAAAGRQEAAHDLAVFLYRAARGAEAEQVLRHAIAAGDRHAWNLLAILLDRMGRPDRAEDVLRQAARTNMFAFQALRHRLRDGEGTPGVCVGPGPAEASQLRDSGTPPEAPAVRDGGSRSRGRSSKVGRKSARHAGQAAAYAATGDTYRPTDTFLTAWKLSLAQRERYLRDQIKAGNNSAACELAVLFVRSGHAREGEQILRSAIVAGDAHAIAVLARLLLRMGRHYEWSLLMRYGLTQDGSTAHVW
jgi:tetratricopeptide (TPR) repeat protein